MCGRMDVYELYPSIHEVVFDTDTVGITRTIFNVRKPIFMKNQRYITLFRIIADKFSIERFSQTMYCRIKEHEMRWSDFIFFPHFFPFC